MNKLNFLKKYYNLDYFKPEYLSEEGLPEYLQQPNNEDVDWVEYLKDNKQGILGNLSKSAAAFALGNNTSDAVRNIGYAGLNFVPGYGQILSTALPITDKLGEGVEKAIANGYKGGIGSTLSNIQSYIPGSKSNLALTAGVAGLERMFGSKINDENVNKIKNNITNTNNWNTNATTYDSLAYDVANSPMVNSISQNQVGKDGSGFFGVGKPKRAKNLYNRLNTQIDLVNDKLNNKIFDARAGVANNVNLNMNKNYYNNFALGGNLFENGGNLFNYGLDFSNGLQYVNAGSTHENNPYQGVPISINEQDGQPNLVEEGEVIAGGDYVFSNRLTVPDDLARILGVPRGKTYAEAVKYLSKESEELPNDPIVKRGLQDTIAKLQESQEQLKQEQQEQEQAMQAILSGQYADGGTINIKEANKGLFTKAAKKAGMGTQEYAHHILANKDDYSTQQIRRANFARNAASWQHANGGHMFYDGGEFDNWTDDDIARVLTQQRGWGFTGLSEAQKKQEIANYRSGNNVNMFNVQQKTNRTGPNIYTIALGQHAIQQDKARKQAMSNDVLHQQYVPKYMLGTGDLQYNKPVDKKYLLTKEEVRSKIIEEELRKEREATIGQSNKTAEEIAAIDDRDYRDWSFGNMPVGKYMHNLNSTVQDFDKTFNSITPAGEWTNPFNLLPSYWTLKGGVKLLDQDPSGALDIVLGNLHHLPMIYRNAKNMYQASARDAMNLGIMPNSVRQATDAYQNIEDRFHNKVKASEDKTGYTPKSEVSNEPKNVDEIIKQAKESQGVSSLKDLKRKYAHEQYIADKKTLQELYPNRKRIVKDDAAYKEDLNKLKKAFGRKKYNPIYWNQVPYWLTNTRPGRITLGSIGTLGGVIGYNALKPHKEVNSGYNEQVNPYVTTLDDVAEQLYPEQFSKENNYNTSEMSKIFQTIIPTSDVDTTIQTPKKNVVPVHTQRPVKRTTPIDNENTLFGNRNFDNIHDLGGHLYSGDSEPTGYTYTAKDAHYDMTRWYNPIDLGDTYDDASWISTGTVRNKAWDNKEPIYWQPYLNDMITNGNDVLLQDYIDRYVGQGAPQELRNKFYDENNNFKPESARNWLERAMTGTHNFYNLPKNDKDYLDKNSKAWGRAAAMHKMVGNRYKTEDGTFIDPTTINDYDIIDNGVLQDFDRKSGIHWTDFTVRAKDTLNQNVSIPTTSTTSTQQQEEEEKTPKVKRKYLPYLDDSLRYVPLGINAASLLYNTRPVDFTAADRYRNYAEQMGTPISSPLATIGNYRRRNPYDESYTANMINQTTAANNRQSYDIAGGNRAMQMGSQSARDYTNLQQLSQNALAAYQANRTDDAQVADFNRTTDETNVKYENARNQYLLQLNNARDLQSKQALINEAVYRQGLRNQRDVAIANDISILSKNLSGLGEETMYKNILRWLYNNGVLAPTHDILTKTERTARRKDRKKSTEKRKVKQNKKTKLEDIFNISYPLVDITPEILKYK